MTQAEQNKAFLQRYFLAVSGKVKTRALIEQYNDDADLVDGILLFEKLFPKYEILVEETVAEDDRVIVCGRLKGINTGEFLNLHATSRIVEVPFAVRYTVRNNRIVETWAISDMLSMFQQMGLNLDEIKNGAIKIKSSVRANV